MLFALPGCSHIVATAETTSIRSYKEGQLFSSGATIANLHSELPEYSSKSGSTTILLVQLISCLRDKASGNYTSLIAVPHLHRIFIFDPIGRKINHLDIDIGSFCKLFQSLDDRYPKIFQVLAGKPSSSRVSLNRAWCSSMIL